MDIKLNPQNPRTIDKDKLQKLCNSIKQFPKMLELRPIIVDRDGVILGGNMRYKAIQDLKMEIKPEWIRVADKLTDEERRRFIVEDNIGFGDWNYDELQTQYSVDELLEWGFDEKELKIDQEIEEDEAPEVSSEPAVSKLGEVYQLGRHRVMCGDSTKIEDVEKLMDGKKADMVFTDPPYGMDFQSNFREKTPQFEKIKNDDVVLDVSPILFTVMKDNTAAYICTRWDLYPQWYSQIEKVFNIKNCVVWYKKGGGLGDLVSSYLPNHEFIIVAHKGQADLRGKRDADVWQLERDGFNDYEHPTQKPIKLSAFAIEHHSDSNSLVVDLFLGSGSTLIACEQTNRICYGSEIDPKYVDVIRKRYAKFIGKETEWEAITPKI